MKNVFNSLVRHTVTEANINYYAAPFIHPRRKMAEFDFIYNIHGEWKIGQNLEEFHLKKDSLLILSPNNFHYGISPCSEGTKTMYFHLSKEEGDDFTDKDIKNEGIMVESFYDASGNRNIKKYFYEIVSAKLSSNDEKASVFFDLLLLELAAIKNNGTETEIGEQIKKIIHKSPERFFTNMELAKLTGVSVKTAETKFKKQFGITIHQYILNHKIEQAIAYFKNFPEITIKEVAYNLGFYDEYHFSKQFKKNMGIAPAIFKEREKQGQ